MSRPPSPQRDTVMREYGQHESLDDARATRVLDALERLGARKAADEACARYLDQAKAVAQQHDLDRNGELAALLDGTANRTV